MAMKKSEKTDTPKHPRPKWTDPNYDKQRRSTKHEKRIAVAFGGKRLPRSGGLPWSKWDQTTDGGDVTSGKLHLEHKRTDAKSLAVKLEWLEKVSDAARRRSKEPGLVITFERKLRPPEDWVLLPMALVQKVFGVGE